MNLRELKLLFIDCQTTGMRPSVGSLLEMAWGWGKASNSTIQSLQSELLSLPEIAKIPSVISEMTGIQDWDLVHSISLEELFKRFRSSYAKDNESSWAVIHYAQFEKPFLQDLFLQFTQKPELPFQTLCSQKIAKKLFPQLPSRNLKGLAGYFGLSSGELKRAGSHVEATFQIWRNIVDELEKQGIFTLEELLIWLSSKKSPTASVRYEYRVEKEKRLALPETPGIYRMKTKSGTILYVGKATSLRNRVNSYFRGKKGRDPKKLEMLTQVWDFDFIQTETVLEASLLENDEIKRLDPPYNISLKAKDRSLRFFSRDFNSANSAPSGLFPLGPFRPQGPLDQLKILQNSLAEGSWRSPFYEPIPLHLVEEGFHIFCQENHLNFQGQKNIRPLLCLGMKLYRKQKGLALDPQVEVEAETGAEAEEDLDKDMTAQEVAEKYQRLCLRAAEALVRARRLTRLLNSVVEWESEIGWKTLKFRNGKMFSEKAFHPQHPWENLGISDYDRMSVLLNEISRHPHKILSLPS